MKNTGIIRRIDDLGRVVIPKEIRKNLHIKEDDPLELYVYDNMVCFKKFSPMSNNQKVIDVAMKLAEKEDLSIAIYDTDKLIAGKAPYPVLVSDDWRKRSLFNFYVNYYDELYDCFIFPIVFNGELCGYIAAQKNQLPDQKIHCVEMIANYLSMVLERE